jgi:magnesium-transporting ATPase (P-type)
MSLKRGNRYSKPLGVTIISTLFLISGLLALLLSLCPFLVGLYGFTHLVEMFPEGGIGPMIAIMVFVGVGLVGIVLSSLVVLSGFGLRKMRRWGLWCSNFTLAVFIFINIFLILFARRSWENLTGICVEAIMTGIEIAIGVYLNRAYKH